jgi:hypothetical protein
MNKKALIISHPSGGFIALGKEEDNKDIVRNRSSQITGKTGASLRIFDDGAWELRSTQNKKGSSLIQSGKGPLTIYSEGDINLESKGTFSVKAKDIVMQATNDIIANVGHDYRVDASNNVKILGTLVGVFSDSKLVLASQGWTFIRGQPIRLIEPKSKLLPTSLKEFADNIINNFLLN